MRVFWVFIVFAISFTQTIWGQDKNAVVDVTHKFMEKLSDGNSREAIISMYARNNFLEDRKTEIEVLMASTEMALQRIGHISEFELVRVERLNPFLERHIYQMYTKSFPIHAAVYAYQAKGEWVVSSFKFNSDISIIRPVANSNDQLPEEPAKMAEGIMEKLAVKKIEEGLSEGFVTADERFFSGDLISKTEQQLNLIFSILGDPVGYSKTSSEIISPRHVKMVYFLNLENHPIAVIFDFYKGLDGGWSVINFNFNDRFNNIEANIP